MALWLVTWDTCPVMSACYGVVDRGRMKQGIEEGVRALRFVRMSARSPLRGVSRYDGQTTRRKDVFGLVLPSHSSELLNLSTTLTTKFLELPQHRARRIPKEAITSRQKPAENDAVAQGHDQMGPSGRDDAEPGL